MAQGSLLKKVRGCGSGGGAWNALPEAAMAEAEASWCVQCLTAAFTTRDGCRSLSATPAAAGCPAWLSQNQTRSRPTPTLAPLAGGGGDQGAHRGCQLRLQQQRLQPAGDGLQPCQPGGALSAGRRLRALPLRPQRQHGCARRRRHVRGTGKEGPPPLLPPLPPHRLARPFMQA